MCVSVCVCCSKRGISEMFEGHHGPNHRPRLPHSGRTRSTSLTCLSLPPLTGPSNSGVPRCQTHHKHYLYTIIVLIHILNELVFVYFYLIVRFFLLQYVLLSLFIFC